MYFVGDVDGNTKYLIKKRKQKIKSSMTGLTPSTVPANQTINGQNGAETNSNALLPSAENVSQ